MSVKINTNVLNVIKNITIKVKNVINVMKNVKLAQNQKNVTLVKTKN